LTNKSLARAGITTVHAGKNSFSNQASSNYTTKISPVLSLCVISMVIVDVVAMVHSSLSVSRRKKLGKLII
jgi:hypothetical protein